MPTHQYSLSLIQREANGSVVQQRSEDGYVNASQLCEIAGKHWHKYVMTEATGQFLRALAVKNQTTTLEFIQEVAGANGVKSIWIHPKVAVHLAQWLSADFAVQVSEWVFDWLNGNGAPRPPAQLPTHLARYLANDGKVPPGYFSVLQETGLNLFGPLHNVGFEIPVGWVPDISVGLGFCKWLRKGGVDTEALPTYTHTYNDHRRPAAAKLYPDEYLASFRRWFRSEWLPENGVKYFKQKDPSSLAYLDRLPALASPTPKMQLGGNK
ncbi:MULTISPECIES: KilA-N domain-containing protein [Oxalobacteraceae]|uniref:KilA-N domain-containing protein n=1 Tax=Herminiimonas sp. Marseille-P9896 TaxID=2742211 RepID=UPI00158C3BC7|nr:MULTISPECIES: KilA-N domain-containing protein [Oxalobacteraceae]